MEKNTIKLKKYLDVIEEYTATAVAITPGDLLELTSDGLVQAHSTDSGTVLPMFALEDELQGKGIDDDYAVSAKIQVWVAVRGEQVFANIVDDEVITTGDFLVSDGKGKLKGTTNSSVALDEFPSSVVGVALEDLDMTDSDDAAIGRCAVRIL
jgi:hypothetical protein